MSMRPTGDREFLRHAAGTGTGGEGAALPPAGMMPREFTEVFGYLFRRFFGFSSFPYRLGRRIGGRLK